MDRPRGDLETVEPALGASRTTKRHLAVVLVCFVLAAASFVSATLFADSRLAGIARLTHDASDNAMPSLAEVGTMRRELANIHLALEQAAEGHEVDPVTIDEHVRELRDAQRAYESLPQFPGERPAWAAARPMVEDVPRLASSVMAQVRAGALREAHAIVTQEVAPVEALADASLLELRRINLEQGTLAARRADSAWSRVRVVSIALDVACAALTAGLAFLALRSARRSVAAEVRRANELDAFAARVAHDIRGPLTPPLFALQQLVRDLAPDSPQRPMVERGLRGLQRANVLVRDLLMFARAAAAPDGDVGALLPEAVAGAVQDLEPEASAAGVRVEVGELPAREVSCSPGVLSSIVGNLVGNAIKYMPAAASTRLVCVRAYEGAERVRVEVSDTGPGVPDKEQKRIFEPYVRADASRPGLGLGLATVKRLVLAHRGALGVQSRSGMGSVFWFELPARPAAARATGGE